MSHSTVRISPQRPASFLLLALLVILPSALFAYSQPPHIELHIPNRLVLPLEKWGAMDLWYDNLKYPPERDFASGTTLIFRMDFTNGYVFYRREVLGVQIGQPRVDVFDRYFSRLFRLTAQRDMYDEIRSTGLSPRVKPKDRGVEFATDTELPEIVRSITGEGGPSLSVSGYRKITFSLRSDYQEGLGTSAFYTASAAPTINMEQQSQLSVTGTIGSKISVKIDQDSRRDTDLENTIKIAYKGDEDEIVQEVEAGNTTLSLPGATYAGYSGQVKGLFGIRSRLQVGPIQLHLIASQEKGRTEKMIFNRGTQTMDRIIHEQDYVRNTYFWINTIFLERAAAGRRIGSFTLFRFSSTGGAQPVGSVYGKAHYDIHNHALQDSQVGWWMQVPASEYYLDPASGYIVMTNGVSDGDAIAAIFTIAPSGGGTPEPWGEARPDTLILNLIKPVNPIATQPTFKYEWKNIYYVGSNNVLATNVDMKLYHSSDPADSTRTDSNGSRTWMTVFGLDNYGTGGTGGPDGKLDPAWMINEQRGHLMFPATQPFWPSARDRSDPQVPYIGEVVDQDSIIYQKTQTNLMQSPITPKYTIKFTVRNSGNTFSLGRFNVIEGSEQVKLNGQVMVKDTDYRIDYYSGTMTLLNQRLMDLSANVEITFEYEPWFAPDTKTLLGARAVYNFDDEGTSWIGTTILYNSQTMDDYKARLGREPRQNTLMDADLKLAFTPDWLSALTDAIPFIDTEAESKVSFDMEGGLLFPNPNTKSTAYVDDFEGAKDIVYMEVRRTAWTLSSAPIDRPATDGEPDSVFFGRYNHRRGKTIWYNPYDRTPIVDIWPNQEVVSAESKVPILNIDFTPSTAGDSSWGGIQHSFYSGYWEQSNIQYLEVWVHGRQGKLVFDLGQVSEDVNGDGLLEQEVSPQEAQGSLSIPPDKDVGLDMLRNVDEPGWSTDNPDPDGDDWNYSDHYDYSRVNGTEGNRMDGDAASRFDTEDISGNLVLDQVNAYFEYEIDLASDEWADPSTESNGWRLYRIPVKDTAYSFSPDGKRFPRKQVGNPSWSQIQFVRIVVTGVSEPTTVQIAKMELVGNRWLSDSPRLSVSTKNTHENQDYYPPPGVAGELQYNTNIRQQEGSLVLNYCQLPPGNRVQAMRTVSTNQPADDLTMYDNFRLWVNGRNVSAMNPKPVFFIKMGTDSLNYYEYRRTIYDEWAPNRIEIPLAKFTSLKDSMFRYDATLTIADSARYMHEISEGDSIFVKNSPSFTNIRWYALGVFNASTSQEQCGELWVDEFEVGGVRRQTGWAMRSGLTVAFADFMTHSVAIEQRNSEFHTLNEDRGTGMLNQSFSYVGGFNLNKFFPLTWGITLPLGLTYTAVRALPRLKTNSDIVLDATHQALERTYRDSRAATLSLRFNTPEVPWWYNLTLNRMTFTAALSRSREDTPLNRAQVDNATGAFVWDLSPKGEWGVKWLSWAGFMGKDVSDTPINLAPSKLRFSLNYTEAKNDAYNKYTVVPTHSFQRKLGDKYEAGMKPYRWWTLDYDLSIDRDLSDSRFWHPSVLQFGLPLGRHQNFQMNIKPKLWTAIDNSFNYQANYNENSDPAQNQGKYISCDVKGTWKLDATFDMRKLIRTVTPKPNTSLTFGEVMQNIAAALDPVKASWTHTRQVTAPRLQSRPSVPWQFALVDDPGAAPYLGETSILQNINQNLRFRKTTTDEVQLSTGYTVKDIEGISFSSSYRYTVTEETQLTNAYDLTLPDLNFRHLWFPKLGFIQAIAPTASSNSGFRLKFNWNKENGKTTSSGRTMQFSPLIAVNMTLKGGVQLTFSHNRTYGWTDNYTGVNKSTDSNKDFEYNASLAYAFSAPKGIDLPIIGTLQFQNNLNLQINFQYKYTLRTNDAYASVINEDETWSIEPRATYQFSSLLNGGASLKIQNMNNLKSDIRRKIREATVWVELRF